MPDRIADEKKVVALMIRMYCRRHCRQQGHNGKTDQTNQANKPGRTDDISQTDTANQLIRTNQFNQVVQPSQFSQTNQTGQTSDTNQTDNSSQFSQTGRTGNTNQADNSSRTDTSPLCPECAALLDYALRRLDSCRFGDGKPSCRKCPVHCYRADMRERIRTVMRWAGPRMIFAARTPLIGTCEIARPRRNPENYANFVKRQGRTGRSRQPNGPIYNR